MSEGTPEGMFKYDLEPEVSDSETPHIIFPTLPTLYGLNHDETIIERFIIIPKPPKPSPNIGKILRKFESESRSRLYEAMAISRSSANSFESDSIWEAYIRWINSKISKLKDFGYDLSGKRIRSGFVPLMELWKLRNAPLYLPAPEIKEVIQEVVQEVVQEVEVDFGHPECVMEEAAAQEVISKDQQTEFSLHQQSIGTSSGEIPDALQKTIEEIKADNALVKERLEKQDMMFQ